MRPDSPKGEDFSLREDLDPVLPTSQKKRTVESLQLQFSESETKVGLCREKFREAEKVCAQSRKVRLQTELNTKNSSEDESEVEALKCALELLVLKHPEV